MKFLSRSLSVRLGLYLSGAAVVLLGIYGFWASEASRSQLEETVIQNADQVSDVIRRATHVFMLRNERAEVFEIVQAIGEQPGMERIRIYDEQGRIRYSTIPDEIDHEVDQKAEACYACHLGEAPVAEIGSRQRYRTFQSHDGHRVLGMIVPIRNEIACWDAGCHEHPPEKRILGVLDVQMSMEMVDRGLAAHNRIMVLLSAGVVFLLVILVTSVLYRMVHRPVVNLIEGTRRLAAGDVGHRILLKPQDELGDLAESFNRMSLELADAKAQSEAWAQTLELRVEEKSRALVRVQEEALQMEKMASMGKLAAIVAHEINNPLAGIRTYAKLLLKRSQRGTPPDGVTEERLRVEHDEVLEQIESEATRCGEIVKHLLQFSRPSRPRAEPCDLNELITGSVRLVQHQIDLKGLTSCLDLDEALPRIVCDPQQIRQAVIAVLINACEAMTGEGTLTVSTRTESSGGAKIEITDTGIGIDEETRKHLFEPFYTTKEGGAGLGLAVVYGIFKSHGGKVEVDSTPGFKTTFRFHLPPHPPEGEIDLEVEA